MFTDRIEAQCLPIEGQYEMIFFNFTTAVDIPNVINVIDIFTKDAQQTHGRF
jgi:hypothetical protein